MKIVKIIATQGNYLALDNTGTAYVLINKDPATPEGKISFSWVKIDDTQKKPAKRIKK